MKKALIIGFGRFGQLLARILESEFEILVMEHDDSLRPLIAARKYKLVGKEQIPEADCIFLAVPISKTEEVIRSISGFVKENQLVMDVCSVKVHPANLMRKYLTGCQLLATHPMFGPDSAKDGLKGLKIVLCPLRVVDDLVEYWKNFWQKRSVEVIVTTPEEHDREAVYSQAFTYTLAKMVNLMEIPEIKITPKSFEAIKTVAEYSANDSLQLFHDMLFYNPYFKDMKAKLEKVMGQTSIILKDIEKEQDI